VAAGDSIYKGKFNDEKNGLKLKHDAPGGRGPLGEGEGYRPWTRFDAFLFVSGCLFTLTPHYPPLSVPPFSVLHDGHIFFFLLA